MVPIRRPFCLGWPQQIVSQQKQQRFRCFFDLVSEKTAKRYTDIFSLPFFVEINAWWHHARDVMMVCNELRPIRPSHSPTLPGEGRGFVELDGANGVGAVAAELVAGVTLTSIR